MTTKKIFGNEILLISALFAIIGLGGITWLVINTYLAPDVQRALNGEQSLVLALLDNAGIIIPILIFGLGIRFIQMAFQIYHQKIESIRWGQVALLWLAIGGGIMSVLLLFTRSQADPSANIEFSWIRGITAAIVPAVLAVACAAGLWVFTRQREFVMRDETLAKRNVRMAWNLLMPTIAILVVVAARPLEKTFITSLTDKVFAGTEAVNYIGLDNYSDLLSMRFDTVDCTLNKETGACRTLRNGSTVWENLPSELSKDGYAPVITIPVNATQAIVLSSTDDSFAKSVINTLHFSVLSVALELLFGLFVAMVVNSKFRGRGIMRVVMLVPWAIPTVISARLWEVMLRDTSSGLINKVFMDLGLLSGPQAWLSASELQINTLVMVDVWKTTPFMALLLLAGLQLIPEDLYEAASIDGASRIQQFFTVTLPLLRPTIAIALVFRSLDALRAFDVFQVLLGTQKQSMATYNYQVLIDNQDMGRASAVSVMIFILISIFTIIYVRSIKIETV
ncbi:MAG: sugar ABC transporter permease [bacterium]|nr:sugar ABC transporter permease [bacterium]